MFYAFAVYFFIIVAYVGAMLNLCITERLTTIERIRAPRERFSEAIALHAELAKEAYVLREPNLL
jgi:hypothetical protein